MKEVIYDFVKRMCDDQEVAAICASIEEGTEGGDVCRRLLDGEAEVLRRAPCAVSFVDRDVCVDSVMTPFVVVGDLFYTRRNWLYERNVGDRIREMSMDHCTESVTLPDTEFYNALRLEQKSAVEAMCSSRFSILTGGPGTGKTHTIARAVGFLREKNPELRLALAAPTGKAAARMTESMTKAGIEADPAKTIHSLLGINPANVTVKFDRTRPLECDWLIVDEASMIGLLLMSKLLDALPGECRLTLVGDVDQLASVERGRIFGDLCRMKGVSLSRLSESARFKSDEDIARLANAVNSGDADAAMAILNGCGSLVKYVDLTAAKPYEPATWTGFEKLVSSKFEVLKKCADVTAALEHINDFRILCAVRKGPFGVERMNEFVKKITGRRSPVPMMVTHNDHMLNVANGDVGVVMPDEPNILYLPGEGGLRGIRTELLPDMEVAFASTVHKSQGSEFKDIAVVLPQDGDNQLLTREILYTGITRTKGMVYLYGGEESVRRCCERTIERISGL